MKPNIKMSLKLLLLVFLIALPVVPAWAEDLELEGQTTHDNVSNNDVAPEAEPEKPAGEIPVHAVPDDFTSFSGTVVQISNSGSWDTFVNDMHNGMYSGDLEVVIAGRVYVGTDLTLSEEITGLRLSGSRSTITGSITVPQSIPVSVQGIQFIPVNPYFIILENGAELAFTDTTFPSDSSSGIHSTGPLVISSDSTLPHITLEDGTLIIPTGIYAQMQGISTTGNSTIVVEDTARLTLSSDTGPALEQRNGALLLEGHGDLTLSSSGPYPALQLRGAAELRYSQGGECMGAISIFGGGNGIQIEDGASLTITSLPLTLEIVPGSGGYAIQEAIPGSFVNNTSTTIPTGSTERIYIDMSAQPGQGKYSIATQEDYDALLAATPSAEGPVEILFESATHFTGHMEFGPLVTEVSLTGTLEEYATTVIDSISCLSDDITLSLENVFFASEHSAAINLDSGSVFVSGTVCSSGSPSFLLSEGTLSLTLAEVTVLEATTFVPAIHAKGDTTISIPEGASAAFLSENSNGVVAEGSLNLQIEGNLAVSGGSNLATGGGFPAISVNGDLALSLGGSLSVVGGNSTVTGVLSGDGIALSGQSAITINDISPTSTLLIEPGFEPGAQALGFAIRLDAINPGQPVNGWELNSTASIASPERTHTVAYRSGYLSGEQSPSPESYGRYAPFVVSDGSLFTRDGYAFAGWASDSDVTFIPGEQYHIWRDLTLTATWDRTVEVHFSGNGNTGGEPPQEQIHLFPEGETPKFSLPSERDLRKDGFQFSGWSLSSAPTATDSIFLPGEAFYPTEPYYLFHAVWAEVVVPIPELKIVIEYFSEDHTGGSVPPPQTVFLPIDRDDSIALPGNPGDLIREGFTFGGWQVEVDGHIHHNEIVLTAQQLATFYSRADTLSLVATPFWVKVTPPYFTVEIHFGGNGNTGGALPESQIYTFRDGDPRVFNLPDGGELSKTGFTFSGWSLSTTPSEAEIFLPGSVFPLSEESYFFHAVWTKVEDNTQGGNGGGGSGGGNTYPNSSGGGGGGGNRTYSSNSTLTRQTIFHELDARTATALTTSAVAEAGARFTRYATVRLQNISTVPAEVLIAMKDAADMDVQVVADSLCPDGKCVEVRIILPNVSDFTSPVNLAGSTSNHYSQNTRTLFQRWFSNPIAVVSLAHTGPFDSPVRIAAKVDLSGMDLDSLCFYTYNSSTNSYARIEAPNHWLDANGYLRFQTGSGGDIVVSSGPLSRK